VPSPSQQDTSAPLKPLRIHSLQLGSSAESDKDCEYSSNNILAVCRQKDVTRATIITMDTTLDIIASWLIDSNRTESFEGERKRWSGNFSYRHKRYPNTNLGVSLGEIFFKPLDFTCHGLLFSFGPINGKLTYKIMVSKLGELKKLCKLGGVNLAAIYRDSIKRRSTVEDYEFNDPHPSVNRRDTVIEEIKNESISLPDRRSTVRVINLK